MIKLKLFPVLVGVTIASASICAFSLRANNQHMVQLRQAVYNADQKGEGVLPALTELQSYVTSHMNTKLDSGASAVYPPIQLKYTYDRLVQARSDKISQTNTQTYNEAQKFCEAQNSTDFSGRNRVPCIEKYVQSNGVQLVPISDALYKFSFVSPVWSPDLAGFSLFTTIVLAVATIIVAVRHFLKKRWFLPTKKAPRKGLF